MKGSVAGPRFHGADIVRRNHCSGPMRNKVQSGGKRRDVASDDRHGDECRPSVAVPANGGAVAIGAS